MSEDRRNGAAREQPLDRLALVGTGLIGTSVGLAARSRAVAREIVAWDPDRQALEDALAAGGADHAAASLGDACAGAEVVVVAAPAGQLPRVVAAALALCGDGTVTDVGSTKAGVCAGAAGSTRFVGGHPLAGAETRGPRAARGDLFEGATWFLTPQSTTAADRYRLIHGFVSALGAVPVAVDPHAHDRLVALTSHVPHVLANLIVNQAGAARIQGHRPLASSGGSLREMTRIAGANPRLWVEIFLDNADVLRDALAEHRRLVTQVEDALARQDAGFLARWIGEARGNRDELAAARAPARASVASLSVRVPDRPGVLAGITQALGAERINIEDFELEHGSDDDGGVLTLVVAGEEQAERAEALVEAQGYSVLSRGPMALEAGRRPVLVANAS
jgi:prephenate dehydrogenase